MTLNPTEQRIIDLTSSLVKMKVRSLPEHPFGHGFLWGNITIRRAQKNGVVKTFKVKTCFGGVCVADSMEAVRLAETVPDVSGVWFNWD